MCCVRWISCLTIALTALNWNPVHSRAEYDPLKVTRTDNNTPVDFTIDDANRDRKIPIRVYLPETTEPAPVVLFSHGLGGSREGCSYLGKHWSARGYVCVFTQHIGTDNSVWKDVPVRQRLATMKATPSVQGTLDRYLDIPAVLDTLETWNGEQSHQLHGRMDLSRIGMSGHSYGANTTQGVSGQSAPLIGQRYTDPRISAAIMFSPNRPRRFNPETAFGKVSIPWLLMTGTKDTSPINDTTVEDRRSVYPALPESIDKYELVLFDGEHHAFSDGQRRARDRNPNHHPAILAISTAFWDLYLKDDQAAKGWLQGTGPRGVLESQDEWQQNLKASP
ncbi:MAG: alpha/beta hydrolase family protein [Rubinisphaera brasiliensis]|uniref:alpha/beta hydrolase family protein n=1 Tax=Rubinisphaera brasiliensis TaxID=119 RepID=UPI00391B3D82